MHKEGRECADEDKEACDKENVSIRAHLRFENNERCINLQRIRSNDVQRTEMIYF